MSQKSIKKGGSQILQCENQEAADRLNKTEQNRSEIKKVVESTSPTQTQDNKKFIDQLDQLLDKQEETIKEAITGKVSLSSSDSLSSIRKQIRAHAISHIDVRNILIVQNQEQSKGKKSKQDDSLNQLKKKQLQRQFDHEHVPSTSLNQDFIQGSNSLIQSLMQAIQKVRSSNPSKLCQDIFQFADQLKSKFSAHFGFLEHSQKSQSQFFVFSDKPGSGSQSSEQEQFMRIQMHSGETKIQVQKQSSQEIKIDEFQRKRSLIKDDQEI